MLAAPGLVPLPELLAEAEAGLGEHGALVDRLGRALAAELPLFARDGGFIAAGYSAELDQLRELRDESRRTIAALQARYAERDRRRRAAHPPQQRHRLLHRGVGEPCRQARRRLHPPPDDGGGACATPRSNWPSSKARSPAPPTAPWRSNCGCSTISSAR